MTGEIFPQEIMRKAEFTLKVNGEETTIKFTREDGDDKVYISINDEEPTEIDITFFSRIVRSLRALNYDYEAQLND